MTLLYPPQGGLHMAGLHSVYVHHMRVLSAAGRPCVCMAIPGLDRYKERNMGGSVLIGILITFLVVILVLYLVQRLPIDGRMRQIVQIIVIIIGIVSLLKYLTVF
jgi:hypothetical protein